jgi:hypothetical protein
VTHKPHPDVHDAGLDDTCERCLELAIDPLRLLDNAMLRRLFAGDLRSDGDRLAFTYLQNTVAAAKAVLSRVAEIYT